MSRNNIISWPESQYCLECRHSMVIGGYNEFHPNIITPATVCAKGIEKRDFTKTHLCLEKSDITDDFMDYENF